MKKNNLIATFLLIVLGISTLWPQDAGAVFGIGGDKKNIPQKEESLHPIHDDATFAEKTKLFHLIPFGDTDLEFEISLPAEWKIEVNPSIESPDLSKKMLAHIVSFTNPPEEPLRIQATVQALQLEHEIDAKNWLKNYILSSGYGLEGEIISDNLLRASGYYVQIQDGAGTHTYITVVISGNNAMLARFQMPLAQKERMHFLQKKSIDSFKLIFTKEETIESQKVFTLVDALKFTFPASWEISNPNFKDLDHLTVQLHNRNISDVLEGYIYFIAVRRNADVTFQKNVQKLRKYFTDEMNLDIKEMISSEKFASQIRFPFGQMESYLVSPKSGKTKNQNLRLLALADPEWYIFVSMISPLAEDNLYTWARNERSFDLITQSIK